MNINKKYRQIPIFLAMLPLLIGNSARPYPISTRYEDFEFSYTFVEINEKTSSYTFNFKNIGNGYISGEYNSRIYYQKENGTYLYLQNNVEPHFGEETLYYQGQEFSVTKELPTSDYDFSKENIYVKAYTDIRTEVNVVGDKTISKVESKDIYYIDVTFENTDNDYAYYAAIKMNYEGDIYCFLGQYEHAKKLSFFDATDKPFDYSKAQIEDIAPVRYKKYKSILSEVAFIIIATLVFLFLLLISPAIVLPIVFHVRKKNRQKNA